MTVQAHDPAPESPSTASRERRRPRRAARKRRLRQLRQLRRRTRSSAELRQLRRRPPGPTFEDQAREYWGHQLAREASERPPAWLRFLRPLMPEWRRAS